MVKALEAGNICFSYRSRRQPQAAVLENLSINLNEGELLFLLGPNGSGKTTLFRCILGLEKCSGSIAVSGINIKSISPPALAKKIAYVPQAHFPSFDYSVFDMVLMGTASGLGEWSLPGARQEKAALEALELTGIAPLARRGFRSLSGGEQQLCLIARAVAQQAGIFIMDEPAANLDWGNQYRILELIQSLCRQGRSIIMSTHNPSHALRYASRVAVLYQRRIHAEGAAGEVLTGELINELYGIPALTFV